jgi:hypothetical protein
VAKHRRKWNASVYQRYIREGRGQGNGAGYKPWIAIQDFASRGMVSRIRGHTTGRVHHLMSNYETSLFYLLDWSDNVIDIREQYPLSNLPEAVEIAEKAQIRYPFDTLSGFPYVLTSDFCIETASGIETIAVKPSAELVKPRVIEKLEVERRYWTSQKIRWRIVTEHEIDMVKARNIEWLAQARSLEDFGMSADIQSECIDFFSTAYPHYFDFLEHIFSETERKFSLRAGMGLNVYKHLAYHKQIHIDINTPIIAIVDCKRQ